MLQLASKILHKINASILYNVCIAASYIYSRTLIHGGKIHQEQQSLCCRTFLLLLQQKLLHCKCSVHRPLSTDTYYRPWRDCLSTTTKIEVHKLSWLPLGVGHGHRVDSCICATIDSTSISLESMYTGPTAARIVSWKYENISPIFISARSLQP